MGLVCPHRPHRSGGAEAPAGVEGQQGRRADAGGRHGLVERREVEQQEGAEEEKGQEVISAWRPCRCPWLPLPPVVPRTLRSFPLLFFNLTVAASGLSWRQMRFL